MKTWISGEIQDDVGHAFRSACNDVENALNVALCNRDYGPAISKWALIPIILRFEDERIGEVRKYHKRRGVVEFRLRIHHASFKSASPRGQRALIFASLLRSVDLFPLLQVDGFDHQAFRADLEQVAVRQGWKDLGRVSGLDLGVEFLDGGRSYLINIGAMFGGSEIAGTRIDLAITSISKTAVAVQVALGVSPGVSINVVFCVPGPLGHPDWDHGRVVDYSDERKSLLIHVAVPEQIVNSEAAFDYLIRELHGANALAFEFFRRRGVRFPLADAERVVARMQETVLGQG